MRENDAFAMFAKYLIVKCFWSKFRGKSKNAAGAGSNFQNLFAF